jgi:uncharacterized protein
MDTGVLIPFAAVAVIYFLGCFVQTTAGFGAALVVAPLLLGLGVLSLNEAVAMMAVTWVCLNIMVLLHYRQVVLWGAIARLIAGMAPAIAVGVAARQVVAEKWGVGILGAMVIAFAIYSLVGPALPRLRDPRWGYAFGAGSGLLSGAYTTGGPPIAIYAMCRGWEPGPFRGSFAAVGLVSSTIVAVGSVVIGDFTAASLRHMPAALVGLAAGVTLGFWANGRISTALFRRIVLLLLMLIGLRLIARAWSLP